MNQPGLNKKIKITDISKDHKVRVQRVGVLEGQIKAFTISLHLTQAIDRAILRGGRIYKLGEQV